MNETQLFYRKAMRSLALRWQLRNEQVKRGYVWPVQECNDLLAIAIKYRQKSQEKI